MDLKSLIDQLKPQEKDPRVEGGMTNIGKVLLGLGGIAAAGHYGGAAGIKGAGDVIGKIQDIPRQRELERVSKVKKQLESEVLRQKIDDEEATRKHNAELRPLELAQRNMNLDQSERKMQMLESEQESKEWDKVLGISQGRGGSSGAGAGGGSGSGKGSFGGAPAWGGSQIDDEGNVVQPAAKKTEEYAAKIAQAIRNQGGGLKDWQQQQQAIFTTDPEVAPLPDAQKELIHRQVSHLLAGDRASIVAQQLKAQGGADSPDQGMGDWLIDKKQKIQNALAGAGSMGLAGGLSMGPVGAVGGAITGGIAGWNMPEDGGVNMLPNVGDESPRSRVVAARGGEQIMQQAGSSGKFADDPADTQGGSSGKFGDEPKVTSSSPVAQKVFKSVKGTGWNKDDWKEYGEMVLQNEMSAADMTPDQRARIRDEITSMFELDSQIFQSALEESPGSSAPAGLQEAVKRSRMNYPLSERKDGIQPVPQSFGNYPMSTRR